LGELPEGPVEFRHGVETHGPEELLLEGTEGSDEASLELVREGVGDERASVAVPEAGPSDDDLVAHPRSMGVASMARFRSGARS
jgi:hypothetical protein